MNERPRSKFRSATIVMTIHTGRVIAFVAVTLSFVAAAWISSRAVDSANQANRGLAAQIRTTRALRQTQLETVQKIADTSCSSRHVLDRAVLTMDRVITLAESKAITQSEQLGPKGLGLKPTEFDRALRNAKKLVRDLKVARRQALAADCKSVPNILHPDKRSHGG